MRGVRWHACAMKEQEFERRLTQVRKALRYWDPIGVIDDKPNGTALGDDEYDGYARGLLRTVGDGADSYKLARHLSFIRSVTIGIGEKNPTEAEADLAEKLVTWRESQYAMTPDFRFDRYAI